MSITKYITGAILSVALTLGAFGLVWLHYAEHHRFLTHGQIFILIFVLAIVQLGVQLVCFLHIGRNSKSWDLSMLAMTLIIVFFIVGGSLWIMSNLAQGQMGNGDMGTMFMGGPPSPQTEQD